MEADDSQSPAAKSEQAGRHLQGVHGASVVETPYLREVRAGFQHMIQSWGIIVVEGVPGVGKTFATDLVAKTFGLPVYWIDMPDKPRGKETMARVLKAVSGQRPNLRTSEYEMTEDLIELLVGRSCIMVVDEAQNLNMSSLRQLRYLHDRRETQFVLALVGCSVHSHVNRSVPELISRVGRTVVFREFRGAQMRVVLDAYHPLFKHTGGEALQILWRAAGGNFRNWARILEVAQTLDLTEEMGIHPEIAKAILYAIQGGRAAQKRAGAAA